MSAVVVNPDVAGADNAEVVADGDGNEVKLSYSAAELGILFRATTAIYLDSAKTAVRGYTRNWWLPFVHALGALLLGVLGMIVVGLIGGLIGGFVMGLIGALALAAFLTTVEAAVDKESISLREIGPRALMLFNPVMSVLFLLFLLYFVASHLLQPSLRAPVVAFMNLVVLTLFNPLPEVAYQERTVSFDSFRHSFEFMRENIIEWLTPFIVLMFLTIIAQSGTPADIVLFFINGDPFSSVMQLGSSLGLVVAGFFSEEFGGSALGGILMLIVFQYVLWAMTYLVFIFRGVLYKHLSRSSRRKRIYRYRAGELS
jgi:hypothetical protein